MPASNRIVAKNALLVLAISLVVNASLRLLYVSTVDIHPEFLPLQLLSVLGLTTFGVSAAAAVYTLVAWKAKSPARTFRMIALGALLLSFLPNTGLALSPSSFPYPGGGPLPAVLLATLHLTPAFLSMTLLPRSPRTGSSESTTPSATSAPSA